MTYPTSMPKLRLHTPADVLAAVPYLLGFHPADSVVALALRHRKVVFHVRIDLLPAGTTPAEITHVAHHLADILDTQQATGMIAVGYGDPPRVTALLLATAAAMRERGLEVVELLRVADGRYWSYECHDPACCSPDGVPYDVSTSVVAAQATAAGCNALPDREALVETLAAPTGPDLAAAVAAAQRAEERLRDMAGPADNVATDRAEVTADDIARVTAVAAAGYQALGSAIGRSVTGGRLTDDDVAWLAVLLRNDIGLRDEAWDRIDVDESSPEIHAALWTDVVRRCAPDVVVAPAVLLGYCCWLLGDGTRAGMAVDRALEIDPECSAALLIGELLWRAVPPSAADAVRGFVPSPATGTRVARKGSTPQRRRRRAARRRC